MKFIIIDDDVNITRMLENIINDSLLGDVVYICNDSLKAKDAILMHRPDIVLIDLLMADKDGISIVKEMSETNCSSKFVMISQVVSKTIISKAYDSGIEFFINKPINRKEVTIVLEKVIEKINLEKKFNMMKSVFNEGGVDKTSSIEDADRNIRLIFSKIGIIGEKGSDDIILICNYLMERNKTFDFKIKEVCEKLSDNPKSMEQRVRRAINKGLVNLANIGIEDYLNDTFTRYSSSLYDFESVKAEMDYIRGKRTTGGKISIRKFIDNIILLKEKE